MWWTWLLFLAGRPLVHAKSHALHIACFINPQSPTPPMTRWLCLISFRPRRSPNFKCIYRHSHTALARDTFFVSFAVNNIDKSSEVEATGHPAVERCRCIQVGVASTLRAGQGYRSLRVWTERGTLFLEGTVPCLILAYRVCGKASPLLNVRLFPWSHASLFSYRSLRDINFDLAIFYSRQTPAVSMRILVTRDPSPQILM